MQVTPLAFKFGAGKVMRSVMDRRAVVERLI